MRACSPREPMDLIVNGRTLPLGEPHTIPHLLETLGLIPATTLVELNGVALHRAGWGGRPLQPGDRIELLRIAAGG
jgi:thiamine biosynthesis protein ThiS